MVLHRIYEIVCILNLCVADDLGNLPAQVCKNCPRHCSHN